MRILIENDSILNIHFGPLPASGLVAGGIAIVDIDLHGAPAQVELVQTLGWLLRTTGFYILPPKIIGLEDDGSEIKYDISADCLIVQLLPNKENAIYKNKEFPVGLYYDHSNRLCGLRLSLGPKLVNAFRKRWGDEDFVDPTLH